MTDELELRWPDKYDAAGQRRPPLRPAVAMEVLERHGEAEPLGHLVLGDNLPVLSRWCERYGGEVDLVYMDPPFMTGGRFDATRKLGGGADAPSVRVPGYEDRWPSRGAFVAMLDDRVRLSRDLLAGHGSLYLHLDPTMSHAAKLLADDVFGRENFQREIIWRIGWISGFKSRVNNWVRNHDVLLFYAREAKSLHFDRQFVPHLPGYERRSGKPSPNPGIPVDDVWNASPAEAILKGAESLDSIQIKSFSREKTGWGTQKNESLLARLVLASSASGGWVVDPFMGSGTTMAVAARLGRRFLGCDRSPLALQLARQRLLALGVPFVLERATSPGARPDPPRVTEAIARDVTCAQGPDGWRVTLAGSLGLKLPSAGDAADGGDAGVRALDGVEAWCVLDAERRVVWDATREASARRDLQHVADIGSRIPKYLRGYGVMGDICEVTLEGDPRGPHRRSYTPARVGPPPPQT